MDESSDRVGRPETGPSATVLALKTGGNVAAVLIGLFLVLFVLYSWWLSQSFRECLGNSDSAFDESATETVTLNAVHPVIEQRVVVHVPAGGLPEGGDPADATIAFLHWPFTDLPARQGSFGVTFVREDTGEVVSRAVESPTTPIPVEDRTWQFESVPLMCQPGVACDRSYRVTVALTDAAPDESVQLAWRVRATVRSDHWADCNVPSGVRPSLDVTKPVGSASLVTASTDVQVARP